jgi:hypothetical protein
MDPAQTSMTCEELAELAADPEWATTTAAGEAARAGVHLAGCPDCRRLVAAQAAVIARLGVLRAAAPPAPPPALEARLRARQAARRRGLPLAAGLAVGAVVAGAAAFALWPGRDHRPAPDRPAGSVAAGGTGAAVAGGPPPAARPGRLRALRFDPPEEPGGFVRGTRVELGAAAAAYLGWPVAADVPRARIQAEVVFGEDGVARGLRFLPASFRSLPLPQEKE